MKTWKHRIVDCGQDGGFDLIIESLLDSDVFMGNFPSEDEAIKYLRLFTND